MADFTLNNVVLKKICAINQFGIPTDAELIFAGIRGSVARNFNDQQFKAGHDLSTNDINYVNPRCTLIQWRIRDGKIAVFPGSTVPHVHNIRSAKGRNGSGANCLSTGFYSDYRKGTHKAGTATGHQAFRQNGIRPIRRSSDDLDYDVDDRVEYDNPHDNLHCGWFGSIDSDSYASAGCQVVMGFPACNKPGRTTNVGPWKIFHENAYAVTQKSFPYILLNGMETMNVAGNVNKKLSARMRFGSSGILVKELQKALKAADFYEGILDGNFGERTMKAVIAFQKMKFGPDATDGIVGPITAEALRLQLPSIL
ncbi:MAG: peptidoglycan-binding protein [Chitinophagaceae bacterium]|nr:MAG: peptidoglycan-binding protein [Chitinophagaceae bacterium]